jgi:hypothetical protein
MRVWDERGELLDKIRDTTVFSHCSGCFKFVLIFLWTSN